MDFSNASFVVNKGGHIVIFTATQPSRKGSPGFISRPPPKKTKSLKKLCFYQTKSHHRSCPFLNLPKQFLLNKRKPFKLCYNFPNCNRPNCVFVHWAPPSHPKTNQEQEHPAEILPHSNHEQEHEHPAEVPLHPMEITEDDATIL